MKRSIFPLLIGLAALLTMNACRPDAVKTHTYTGETAYALTPDSTRGCLKIDMSVEWPVSYPDAGALHAMQSDLVGRLFGEAYRGEAYADSYSGELLLLPVVMDHMRNDFRAEMQPYLSSLSDEETGLSFNHEYRLTLSAAPLCDGHLFTFLADEYSYTGGAHGMNTVTCLTYDLSDGHRLTEDDLFRPGYTEPLTDLLRDRILSQAEDASLYWTKDIKPNGNFRVTPDGLSYVFNPYEIAPYAAGRTTVELPFDALKEWLREDSAVSHLTDY